MVAGIEKFIETIMESKSDMSLLEREWTEEYLEYYVKKYLEEYEESTSDTSEDSDCSFIDWNFQKKGLLERERLWLKAKRQKKITKHFNSMVRYSTFHGLQFCFKKENPLRRTIWWILLLICNGLLVQKMFESTQHYLDYPFSTTRSVKYEDTLTFPAVSLCNLNDMRLSKMEGTKLHELIKLRDRISEHLSGEEYRSTIRQANHRLQDMLYACWMDGVKCSADDFALFNHKQGDKCFTFNSGKPSYKLIKTNRIGPGHALELILNIEYWDYYYDATQSGIHLILHGQEETPVTMQAVRASPGFVTYVEVKKQKRRNLPSPYKTKCGSLELKYFKGYSMHLCWLEKLTDYVVGNCGCKEWFMPGDYKVCSLKVLENCLWPKWAAFDKFKMYSCPLPCVIDSFTYKLSFSRFPTHEGSTKLAQDLNLNGTETENHEFLTNNFMKIVIYYGDLSYEYLEQQPAYDLLVFLGDIGGQIGLFVGASVLTFVEFIDCISMCIHARFFEIFKPRETQL